MTDCKQRHITPVPARSSHSFQTKGVPFWSLQTQEANPGTKPVADEYRSLAKPLAAALPCKHKASLYLPSCEGAARASGRRVSRVPLSTAALPGLFLLCSGARISNISVEISFNSCSGSSRRSWLNTHFCLNVGPK